MINQSLRFLFTAAVLFLFIAEPSWAAEPCKGLSMNLTTALIELNVSATPVLPITISRSASANGDCSFFIVIDNGGAISFSQRVITHGGDSYPIQFYTDTGRSIVFKALGEGTGTEYITGTFIGNSRADLVYNYYPKIDPGYSAPAGPYLGGFKLYLYQGAPNSYDSSAKASNNVNFKYTKGNYADISLVDKAAPFNINDTTQSLNFGPLVTGAHQEFDIVLDYNSGYNLTMSSANNGKLKNENLTITTQNVVPYTITLNSGAQQTLNDPNLVRSTMPTGSVALLGGTRIPVSVIIGNLATALPKPGTYSDVVTIRVSAN